MKQPSINELGIRERVEDREAEILSPYAARSRESRGRMRPEPPDPVRTAFQRDRDRIIHTKAFRRLRHKTQVFIAPIGDHYETRLTHTLEVSQIARTITRALRLNEDLTEAIAMGHDLGHTPFGHLGEETLNTLYHSGFAHAGQSLRVVDVLEKDGKGLNLTWEVRDGILNHSKPRESVAGEGRGHAGTFEGEIVRISDSVAYINHDIEDGIRSGLITQNDLPEPTVKVLGETRSGRINTMVCDIIESSWAASGATTGKEPSIGMSKPVLEATNEVRDFLFRRVYNAHSVGAEASRAKETLVRLYAHFIKHPGELPEEYRMPESDVERMVVDHIAGMTDQFAFRTAEDLGLIEK
jgi:dGTPase